MSKEIKPIRRSRQLTPWSKDHHEGLLLCWKIRQGLKNGTGRALIADYVRWFWQHHLEKHFREEEKMLGLYLQGNEMVERMFREHDEIRAAVRSKNLETDDALKKFTEILDAHIRFEERELFGVIEKVVPEADLNRIEEQIIHDEKNPGVWENEFWLKKP